MTWMYFYIQFKKNCHRTPDHYVTVDIGFTGCCLYTPTLKIILTSKLIFALSGYFAQDL